jgi:hypothetical protein
MKAIEAMQTDFKKLYPDTDGPADGADPHVQFDFGLWGWGWNPWAGPGPHP